MADDHATAERGETSWSSVVALGRGRSPLQVRRGKLSGLSCLFVGVRHAVADTTGPTQHDMLTSCIRGSRTPTFATPRCHTVWRSGYVQQSDNYFVQTCVVPTNGVVRWRMPEEAKILLQTCIDQHLQAVIQSDSAKPRWYPDPETEPEELWQWLVDNGYFHLVGADLSAGVLLSGKALAWHHR